MFVEITTLFCDRFNNYYIVLWLFALFYFVYVFICYFSDFCRYYFIFFFCLFLTYYLFFIFPNFNKNQWK